MFVDRKRKDLFGWVQDLGIKGLVLVAWVSLSGKDVWIVWIILVFTKMYLSVLISIIWKSICWYSDTKQLDRVYKCLFLSTSFYRLLLTSFNYFQKYLFKIFFVLLVEFWKVLRLLSMQTEKTGYTGSRFDTLLIRKMWL